VLLQDWEDLGNLGVDMTMACAGELLASRYGVAVLVMRTLPNGHLTGQLFMRGNAGEHVCVVGLPYKQASRSWNRLLCAQPSDLLWSAPVKNVGLLERLFIQG
jgi:hypothetical protein